VVEEAGLVQRDQKERVAAVAAAQAEAMADIQEAEVAQLAVASSSFSVVWQAEGPSPCWVEEAATKVLAVSTAAAELADAILYLPPGAFSSGPNPSRSHQNPSLSTSYLQ